MRDSASRDPTREPHYVALMAESSLAGTSAGAPASDLPDGVDTAELFASGTASALELLDEAIARADRLNPQINAIIGRLDGNARQAAESHDAARDAGAGGGTLAGVPFLTKDLTCTTEGQPYHAGNAALKDAGYAASSTAHLATMFAALGLVNFGRTNTPEFGLTITTEPVAYGPTANPWNTGHSTGGSSGGSAAAVAAGIVPIAHANDGGGSIRVPAANCGLFGLKPNRGRVSLGPDSGDGWAGFSVDGVVSRSVRDSARVLDGISRPWPGDPYWAPPPSDTFESAAGREPQALRVGLCAHSEWGPTDAQCRHAVEAAGRLAESLGHKVDYSHPAEMFHEEFFDHFRTIVSVQKRRHAGRSRTSPGPAHEPARCRRRHVGALGNRAQCQRNAVCGRARVVPCVDATPRRMVGFSRCPGLADHGRAAASPRRVAQPRDRPRPAERTAALHAPVQRVRAACDVGAAELDRVRTSRGRAVRRSPRRRGNAAVARRPAGARRAMGGAHTASLGRDGLRRHADR